MLILTSLLVLIFYITCVIIKFGIPTSLSESYYLLGGSKNLIASFFTIVLWFVGLSILPILLDITREEIQFIPFITVSGLMFVGAAPLFKSYEKKIHFTGAIFAMVGSIVWILLQYSNLWSIIPISFLLAFIGLTVTKTSRCWVFWLEMSIFLMIYIILIILMGC